MLADEHGAEAEAGGERDLLDVHVHDLGGTNLRGVLGGDEQPQRRTVLGRARSVPHAAY